MCFFTDINECEMDPCFNGGTCEQHVNDYTCTCVTGYTDKSCQTSKDELSHILKWPESCVLYCKTFCMNMYACIRRIKCLYVCLSVISLHVGLPVCYSIVWRSACLLFHCMYVCLSVISLHIGLPDCYSITCWSACLLFHCI